MTQDLMDRDEITQLVYRLGSYLDEGRFHEMASIVTEDAVAQTPGGRAEGRDALIAQASRNHSDDQHIQHVISNVLVGLDGDRAEVRANLIATFAPAADPLPEPTFTLGEVYRFEVARTAQGWRLSRIETTPVWATGTRP